MVCSHRNTQCGQPCLCQSISTSSGYDHRDPAELPGNPGVVSEVNPTFAAGPDWRSTWHLVVEAVGSLQLFLNGTGIATRRSCRLCASVFHIVGSAIHHALVTFGMRATHRISLVRLTTFPTRNRPTGRVHPCSNVCIDTHVVQKVSPHEPMKNDQRRAEFCSGRVGPLRPSIFVSTP